MNKDTITKALLMFGSLEIVCVDMRSKKKVKITTLPIHVNLGFMHMLSHVTSPYFVASL